MGKLMQGVFTPKNRQKYMGKNVARILYRSSWELAFMQKCDIHPNILLWSSESVYVPYRHPISGKWTVYIPDFVYVYIDKNNQQHCEMLEIKPEKEMPGYGGKVSKNTKLIQIVNAAKWQAAIIFCKKKGWQFRVASDRQLFAYKR